MKMNTQLASLISIEQTAQSTAAMAYLGSTATVDGATAKLESGSGELDVHLATSRRTRRSTSRTRPARWSIRAAFTVNAGQQNFVWDGRGNNGTK